MAISEFEIKRCEHVLNQFIDKIRPPTHIRKELDFGYKIIDQSIEIYEIRPEWRNPEKKMELPVAKATYVKKHNVWKIFWQRQDLKWHSYDPAPSVKTLDDFLTIISEDTHSCFFG